MSDNGLSYEDEAEDQTSRNPLRAHVRKLEEENKALREKAQAAEAAQRELAFAKAGIDLNVSAAKYFVKAYDGDLTPEAIRSAAEEINLIAKRDEAPELKAEQEAWNRIKESSKAGIKSEPPMDWNDRLANAKSQEEVMSLLAQAKQQQTN